MKEQLERIWIKAWMGIRRIGRRVTRYIKQYIHWFVRQPYAKGVSAALVITLAAGSLIGYTLGKHLAVRSVGQDKKEIIEKYEKEKAELKDQLHLAQIQDSEERPWYLTLVNDTHPMEEGYVPELAGIGGDHSVDSRIAEPLKEMLADAKEAGLNMLVCSSYRSVERQQELYDEYMGEAVRAGKSYWQALAETRKSTAHPGRSEHNLGLAVDIVSANYTNLDTKQEETPEAKWLAENCSRYGFILRYPVDKTDITGIIYEPWHYRYVGVEDAMKITEMGITLEEYLGED